MRRYGIPASVTLAQGILESSNGQSQLAKKENNHFGIKATKSWIASGGTYGLYTDNKPNENFCHYASVGDSYEHHSKFLKENKRYAACFRLSPDDYRGWAQGLERAGYTTAGKYAPSLISIIERNNLQKYDQMVMAEMKAQGKNFGAEQNPRAETVAQGQVQAQTHYSFPVKRDEFLLVTSPFGTRQDPIDTSKQQMHKGIDIRCRNDTVMATEDHGKVVAVNHNTNTAGGKSVTIEYSRENGEKCQVCYLHLSAIDVKAGDEVNAGQKVGVSGNTGTRTTGEHLHFGVKQINADGTVRHIDPAAYLADIAQKGNISLKLMSNGQDLLAKYKMDTPDQGNSNDNAIDTNLSPDEWMKKLLSSEDSGVNMSNGDPVVELAMTMFSSLLALAMQIDSMSEEEKMQAVTDAAIGKRIDLSTLVPNMKACALAISDDGRATLLMNNGSTNISHVLTVAEQNRLVQMLNSTDINDETKRQRIGTFVNGIAVSQQLSQNYEQQAIQSENQVEVVKR